ncbi:MAG TPA: sensor histidine kinase [Terriglobales bacterium]|nr:sensor histidine kinase [Terriglobales bacterium]
MKVFPDKLFPVGNEHRWVPLIWLPYFAFFWLQLILDHASARTWAINSVGGAIFLFLFFGMFWDRCQRHWYYLVGILALGLVLAPSNGGAATFFIYATAFTPFLCETEGGALTIMLLITAAAGLETRLLHLSIWFFAWAGGFSLVIGVGNIFFAQRNRANARLRMASDEIEHLAKVAERERIARDLHDVLGHTLSVIILKSELAGKLIERDPARARAEIADVERTSREALAEVRNTIRGYRSQSLEAEIKHAETTLQTAGVSVRAETQEVPLSPAQESVVALVVREAVTNVVRHAHARSCHLRLAPVNGNCLLEIADDGRGGDLVEGNGLRGMRERVEALGGTLERQTAAGTRLTIRFPLLQSGSNGTH